MTDEKQTSVIEKIKKLFAMGQRHTNNDGTSNEQEAESAMKMAQELLTKYNLDLSVIKDAAEKAGAKPAVGKREKVKINRSAMYRWQQELWSELAKANFCFHWVVETYEHRWGKERRVKRHVILGSEANVAVVQMMGEYLTETIERLVLEHYSKAESLSGSANSWRTGCADRLIARIQERAERMKQEGFTAAGSTCTGLAVQDLHIKEYAANYDAQYGEGAYARMQANNAAWKARAAERQAEYDAQRKKAQEERARMLGSETPEQREKREKAEAAVRAKQEAADARWWARQRNKKQRQEKQRDMVAYAKGHKSANSISLDSQIKGEN